MTKMSKISLTITAVIQAAFLVLMALMFLGVWAVTVGVPYILAFVFMGVLLICFLPVELFCFIANLTVLIIDLLKIDNRTKLIIPAVITFVMPVFLIVTKVLLYNYANVLVPIV